MEIDDDRDEMRYCFDYFANKYGEHVVRTGVLPMDGVQDDNRQWTSKDGERCFRFIQWTKEEGAAEEKRETRTATGDCVIPPRIV